MFKFAITVGASSQPSILRPPTAKNGIRHQSAHLGAQTLGALVTLAKGLWSSICLVHRAIGAREAKKTTKHGALEFTEA